MSASSTWDWNTLPQPKLELGSFRDFYQEKDWRKGRHLLCPIFGKFRPNSGPSGPCKFRAEVQSLDALTKDVGARPRREGWKGAPLRAPALPCFGSPRGPASFAEVAPEAGEAERPPQLYVVCSVIAPAFWLEAVSRPRGTTTPTRPRDRGRGHGGWAWPERLGEL